MNPSTITGSENLKSLRGTIVLVAGGPPCQGFSMAGRRVENDSRNDLINSYINITQIIFNARM